MSAPTDLTTPAVGVAPPGPRVRVDRVACSGHGICAQLLVNVSLDEWGYPVVLDAPVDARQAQTAVRLCPARALWVDPGRRP